MKVIDKLKSRKLWVAVLTVITVTVYGEGADVPAEWIAVLDTIMASVYVISEALIDLKKK